MSFAAVNVMMEACGRFDHGQLAGYSIGLDRLQHARLIAGGSRLPDQLVSGMPITDSASPVSAGAELALPIYVGSVDLDRPGEALDVGARFRSARLLLTRGGCPVGFAGVALDEDGRADADAVRRAVGAWMGPEADEAAGGVESRRALGSRWRVRTMTVAVCTRNRPEHLADCLATLLAAPDSDVRFLVVDNDPDDDSARGVVDQAARADRRLRYVREPRRGLSAARNRVLAEVDTDVVAFVDDDVRIGPRWPEHVRRAFVEHPQAPACVTGPVFSAVLATPAQVASEAALGWSKGLTRRFFSAACPSSSPIFPFSPGEFGVGANFAVSVPAARAVGGFDPALGVGSSTRGGEDIDFFVRLVLAGHGLLYDPSSYVWHHHRGSAEDFREQLVGYGMGLGAFLAKIAIEPGTRRLAVQRTPAALAHLRVLRRREAGAGVTRSDGLRKILALARGATAYGHSRWRTRDRSGPGTGPRRKR
jgi:GT2 family glycosyltransferase